MLLSPGSAAPAEKAPPALLSFPDPFPTFLCFLPSSIWLPSWSSFYSNSLLPPISALEVCPADDKMEIHPQWTEIHLATAGLQFWSVLPFFFTSSVRISTYLYCFGLEVLESEDLRNLSATVSLYVAPFLFSREAPVSVMGFLTLAPTSVPSLADFWSLCFSLLQFP